MHGQVAARERGAGVHDWDDVPEPDAGRGGGDGRGCGAGEQRGGAAVGVGRKGQLVRTGAGV